MDGSSDREKGESLQSISGDLFYELWMVRELSRRISPELKSKDIVQYNAFLESFLVHARILTDFLYKNDPRLDKPAKRPYDDVFVSEFFDCPEDVTSWLPEKSKDLHDFNYKVGKKIMHLTASRSRSEIQSHRWNVQLISENLDRAMRAFEENVAKDKLGAIWKSSPADSGGENRPNSSSISFVTASTTFSPRFQFWMDCGQAHENDD